MVLVIFPHGVRKYSVVWWPLFLGSHLTTRSLSCPSLLKVRDPIDIGLNHTSGTLLTPRLTPVRLRNKPFHSRGSIIPRWFCNEYQNHPPYVFQGFRVFSSPFGSNPDGRT